MFGDSCRAFRNIVKECYERSSEEMLQEEEPRKRLHGRRGKLCTSSIPSCELMRNDWLQDWTGSRNRANWGPNSLPTSGSPRYCRAPCGANYSP